MCTISFVLANMGAVKNNVFLYKDVHSRKNHRARKTVAMLLLNQNRINECRECMLNVMNVMDVMDVNVNTEMVVF
jgi:hypothetical protein